MDLNSNSSIRERHKTARMIVEKYNNKKRDRNFNIKNRFQDWVERFDWEFMVTIPCDNNRMSEEEFGQRLRIFSYNLNKKYMINRFSRLSLRDRITNLGFVEYTTTGDRHMHILTHFPEHSDRSGFSKTQSPFRCKKEFVAMDIIQDWVSILSMESNGIFRKIKLPHIMRIKKEKKESVSRYVSKQLNLDWDSILFGDDSNITYCSVQ